jgi:hypothetical protein
MNDKSEHVHVVCRLHWLGNLTCHLTWDNTFRKA